ncbi:right-handed parallel beta-helix repeat-containing protein [Marilutibacter alkalisoli]|uniref:right-handed parallel beta-helix repeat-containing protein n=1 Tax=Marilutibacter alkalisoli TaxID=2591633 RepID=UPI00141D88C8|nr:right-handed parallel beta-helix repeat-containing protein [Lysobacter alkalisoli]
MFLTVLPIAIAALLVFSPVHRAHAAGSYGNCTGFIDSLPATIGTQGTWCLRKDLSTGMSSGNAITVNANNVTLDCNGFKIGGLAAGVGTNANGIRADNRFNLTVRRCNVRGFRAGIHTSGGGGHLIEHNRLDGNTLVGLAIQSSASRISSNHVIDTGGSTATTGFAEGVFATSGVDIVDNTVSGVLPTPNGSGIGWAYGIYANSNDGGTITGNRVRGLVPAGAGAARGIYDLQAGRAIVRGNDVQGNGGSGSVGVHCSNNKGTARDNLIAGFETGIQNCLASGNTVNGN